MRVGIWDLDYYYNKKKINNVDLMKISSFHKQLGDSVNLFEDDIDTRRPYELVYVSKNDVNIPTPPVQFMKRNNLRLIGTAFKFFKTWHIDDFILACRPDYMLYPDKSTRESRAEIIQLCNHQGKWLGLTQRFDNTFKNKEIIVADDGIWNASPETINKCLDTLLELKNLSFLHPISLSSLMSDETIAEKFSRLKFFTNGKLEIKNDWSDEFSAAVKLSQVLETLLHNNYELKTIRVGFKPLTVKQHLTNEEGVRDFERCLKIVDLGKQKGLQFFIEPPDRLRTPYAIIFEELSKWSSDKRYWAESFVEFFTKKLRFKYKCGMEDLFSHSEWWNDEVFYTLLRTFKAHPMWMEDYCFRKTGDKFYDKQTVNWREIKEKVL